MLSAKRDKGDFESMRAAVLLMAVGCVESLVSKLQDCCMYVLLDSIDYLLPYRHGFGKEATRKACMQQDLLLTPRGIGIQSC